MLAHRYKPFDPIIFWGNVRRLTEAADMSINELAKKVHNIYGISPQTINNCHTDDRLSNIAHAIAIAGILRVPLDVLLREDMKNAEKLEGYEDFQSGIEGLARGYKKVYGLDITYNIHLSDKFTSFKLICSVSTQLENIYPDRYSSTTGKISNEYNVINGNIYPSNLDKEEAFYNRPSIYEYIDSFCRGDNDKEKFNRILKLFSSYHKARYSLGAIGNLSPFAFYLLNYEIGRLVKRYNER